MLYFANNFFNIIMDINKKCVPCQGGIPPLDNHQINLLLTKLSSQWKVYKDKELIKSFKFQEYLKAIKFVNLVVSLSEEQGHHPYIHINYKEIKIILFTHKIDGLHENDFLMAIKIDEIFKNQSQ